MANELPEVVPDVQSMPTTGWFCQTRGNARRRITKNVSSRTDGSEGIYDVAGVPGHTHNASAVISVDANYSEYRRAALNVPAGVWAYNLLALPPGLLMDSVEPDNASERYDRAIERCVGYVSLFPENCTGHIKEPTRSIGEVRTLVAPRARLDTLTYLEERRGWIVPVDADDEKNDPLAALVSDFPDIDLDMRPLQQVRSATLAMDVAPSTLFMQTPGFRYRIVGLENGSGSIGTFAEQASAQAVAQVAVAAAVVAVAATAAPIAAALVAVGLAAGPLVAAQQLQVAADAASKRLLRCPRATPKMRLSLRPKYYSTPRPQRSPRPKRLPMQRTR